MDGCFFCVEFSFFCFILHRNIVASTSIGSFLIWMTIQCYCQVLNTAVCCLYHFLVSTMVSWVTNQGYWKVINSKWKSKCMEDFTMDLSTKRNIEERVGCFQGRQGSYCFFRLQLINTFGGCHFKGERNVCRNNFGRVSCLEFAIV